MFGLAVENHIKAQNHVGFETTIRGMSVMLPSCLAMRIVDNNFILVLHRIAKLQQNSIHKSLRKGHLLSLKNLPRGLLSRPHYSKEDVYVKEGEP
ncbi:hypothetical protein RIF29_30992 [Crotalaria pallida]|uniref:Uncharacterized protein n=1 Tax=Crotalaria pallida TaxID=3830 RepID=A0AAN9HXB0_CROPI